MCCYQIKKTLEQEKITIVSGRSKLADIILEYPGILLMMEHFDIEQVVGDYTLSDLCKNYPVSEPVLLNFTNLYLGNYSLNSDDFHINDIKSIVPYLRNCHRYYQHEIYPVLRTYIGQMHQMNDQAGILMLENFFNEYFKEVLEHLEYEDKLVFPYIDNLFEALLSKKQQTNQPNYTVNEYMEHHNDINEKLNDLKNLLIKYLPVRNDQSIRRRLLISLAELEKDLEIHSLIEEKLLVPLVKKLEIEIASLK